MFETFNCGVGIDVVGADDPEFEKVLQKVSEETNITMFDLGVCKEYKEGKNKIELETKYGSFTDY